MGVCLYLYLHTNTDEEVYRRLWTRQFTVVLSWGNGATRGLPDSTYMSHHLIFFSQMCYFTDDLFFPFPVGKTSPCEYPWKSSHFHESIHAGQPPSPRSLSQSHLPAAGGPPALREGAHRTVTSAGRRPWSSTLPVWSCRCRTPGSSGCSGPTAAEDVPPAPGGAVGRPADLGAAGCTRRRAAWGVPSEENMFLAALRTGASCSPSSL